MPQPKSRPLSVALAAARFGVSTRTIQRWVAAGHFPGAYKLSPGLRSPFVIPLDDVLAYEKKLASAPGGAKAS